MWKLFWLHLRAVFNSNCILAAWINHRVQVLITWLGLKLLLKIGCGLFCSVPLNNVYLHNYPVASIPQTQHTNLCFRVPSPVQPLTSTRLKRSSSSSSGGMGSLGGAGCFFCKVGVGLLIPEAAPTEFLASRPSAGSCSKTPAAAFPITNLHK